MALFLFTRSILEGKPIKLFNHGNHTRDFTYVDDIAAAVVAASDDVAAPDPAWDSAAPDPATSDAPFRLFNIGNSSPVKLRDYVAAIERELGRKAEVELLPLQPGDVPDTYADVGRLTRQVGYRPATTVEEGVARFVRWYRSYYGV
jgi:UDP-glucuronate 4-epimerase